MLVLSNFRMQLSLASAVCKVRAVQRARTRSEWPGRSCTVKGIWTLKLHCLCNQEKVEMPEIFAVEFYGLFAAKEILRFLMGLNLSSLQTTGRNTLQWKEFLFNVHNNKTSEWPITITNKRKLQDKNK